MSKFKHLLLVVAVLFAFVPASAQFKIGPRVGIAVNSLHFNKEIANPENQAGFTGGLQAEFTVPLIGVGADLSVMYVHRYSKWMRDQEPQSRTNDYIELPLNFKYKLKIPAISSIIAPYVFTGPSFSFLVSKKVIDDVKARKCDVAWNFGLGLELIKHLQIGASYGLGLTKALEFVNLAPGEAAGIDGKNRYWTVTAAWLF